MVNQRSVLCAVYAKTVAEQQSFLGNGNASVDDNTTHFNFAAINVTNRVTKISVAKTSLYMITTRGLF